MAHPRALLGISDKLLGFLLIEELLTNVGGLLTLISSVPNIVVGNAAGISCATFFAKAAPYVMVTTAVTIGMGAKIFGIRRLAGAEEQVEALRLIAGFDENDGINSPFRFWFGGLSLVGANLGGNITPIGSASTLVAVTIIHKSEIKLSFAGFVKRAVPFATVQLGIAEGYLLVAL